MPLLKERSWAGAAEAPLRDPLRSSADPKRQVLPATPRAVVSLTAPIVLSNTLVWASGFVNVFMVSRLGETALAALGMSNQLMFMLTILIFGVTTGTMALVARLKGANDEGAVSQVLRQSILMAVAQSVVIGTVGVLTAPWLLQVMGATDSIAATGAVYLRVLFIGMAATTLDFTIASALRGAGDSVTPLRINVVVILLNVAGNYLLIFGPGPFPALGVLGVAISTVLARTTGVFWGWRRLKEGKSGVRMLPGSWRPDWPLMRRVLGIGVPSACEAFIRSGSYVALTAVIARTSGGATALAANTVGLQMEAFSRGASVGIGTGATALVGQRLGAGDPEGAERAGWIAAGVGAGFLAVVSLVQFVLAPRIAGLFSSDPGTVVLVMEYLRLLALGQPVYAVAMVLAGALRGGGDTRFPMWASIISGWVFLLPAAYWFGIRMDLGPTAVWIVQAVNYGVFGILLVSRFRAGGWRKIRV